MAHWHNNEWQQTYNTEKQGYEWHYYHDSVLFVSKRKWAISITYHVTIHGDKVLTTSRDHYITWPLHHVTTTSRDHYITWPLHHVTMVCFISRPYQTRSELGLVSLYKYMSLCNVYITIVALCEVLCVRHRHGTQWSACGLLVRFISVPVISEFRLGIFLLILDAATIHG